MSFRDKMFLLNNSSERPGLLCFKFSKGLEMQWSWAICWKMEEISILISDYSGLGLPGNQNIEAFLLLEQV